jgi:hypothetical protein
MKLASLASENAIELRQIVDTTKCNSEALKAMKQSTDSWDMISIYTLTQKLDNKTKRMRTSYFQQITANLKSVIHIL